MGVFNDDGLGRLHFALISMARQLFLKHCLDDKALLFQNIQRFPIAGRMSNPGISRTRPSASLSELTLSSSL